MGVDWVARRAQLQSDGVCIIEDVLDDAMLQTHLSCIKPGAARTGLTALTVHEFASGTVLQECITKSVYCSLEIDVTNLKNYLIEEFTVSYDFCV